jgi:Ca2+/Na+ antiporter
LVLLGLITACIKAYVHLLGCLLGVDDSIMGITIVSVGMGITDLFVSRRASKKSMIADPVLVLFPCINCFNIFLSIGLQWMIKVGHTGFIENRPFFIKG